MPDSIREQIIQAVLARVQTIDANALRAPIIQRSYEGDALTGLIDDEDAVEQAEYDSVVTVMGVRVQRVVKYDPDTENRSVIANEELAAMIAAVTDNADPTMGGLADYIRYSAGAPIYETGQIEYIGIALAFEIRYRFDIDDPYSNANSDFT